jgi:hypothetical protein
MQPHEALMELRKGPEHVFGVPGSGGCQRCCQAAEQLRPVLHGERARRTEPRRKVRVLLGTGDHDAAPAHALLVDVGALGLASAEITAVTGEHAEIVGATQEIRIHPRTLEKEPAFGRLREPRFGGEELARDDALRDDRTRGAIEAVAAGAEQRELVQTSKLADGRIGVAQRGFERGRCRAHRNHVFPILAHDLVRRARETHQFGARQRPLEFADGEWREQHETEAGVQQRGAARCVELGNTCRRSERTFSVEGSEKSRRLRIGHAG